MKPDNQSKQNNTSNQTQVIDNKFCEELAQKYQNAIKTHNVSFKKASSSIFAFLPEIRKQNMIYESILEDLGINSGLALIPFSKSAEEFKVVKDLVKIGAKEKGYNLDKIDKSILNRIEKKIQARADRIIEVTKHNTWLNPMQNDYNQPDMNLAPPISSNQNQAGKDRTSPSSEISNRKAPSPLSDKSDQRNIR